jgi:hypothetical protein
VFFFTVEVVTSFCTFTAIFGGITTDVRVLKQKITIMYILHINILLIYKTKQTCQYYFSSHFLEWLLIPQVRQICWTHFSFRLIPDEFNGFRSGLRGGPIRSSILFDHSSTFLLPNYKTLEH